MIPGSSRRRIARRLNVAFADGLLSEETFVQRLEHLLGTGVVDPGSLIGDLTFRGQRGWRGWVAAVAGGLRAWWAERAGERELLLGLDWTGARPEVLIGRHHACDVVLTDPTVSRQHARMVFRDGSWIIQDLDSTNGTLVNGTGVGRCALRAGDRLALGRQRLRID